MSLIKISVWEEIEPGNLDIVAARTWPAVPRVGDYVEVGNGASKKRKMVVKLVRWSSTPDGMGDCQVNLIVVEDKR